MTTIYSGVDITELPLELKNEMRYPSRLTLLERMSSVDPDESYIGSTDRNFILLDINKLREWNKRDIEMPGYKIYKDDEFSVCNIFVSESLCHDEFIFNANVSCPLRLSFRDPMNLCDATVILGDYNYLNVWFGIIRTYCIHWKAHRRHEYDTEYFLEFRAPYGVHDWILEQLGGLNV